MWIVHGSDRQVSNLEGVGGEVAVLRNDFEILVVGVAEAWVLGGVGVPGESAGVGQDSYQRHKGLMGRRRSAIGLMGRCRSVIGSMLTIDQVVRPS